jgi:hypothetical protein
MSLSGITPLRVYTFPGEKAIENVAKRGVSHPSWLRLPLIPVTIICGPPCAGKTTYVLQRIKASEVCIDLDQIVRDLTNLPRHSWTEIVLDRALYKRNKLLGKLTRKSKWTKAWFIVSEPKAAWRNWWCKKLGTEDIIVLETPASICISRTNNPVIIQVIEDWWKDYNETKEEKNKSEE